MAVLFDRQGTHSLATMRYSTFSKKVVSASSFVTTERLLSTECVTNFIFVGHLPIIELAMYVCVYVSHVLDRKLLERLMSPSPKSQVMFASAFS